MAEEIKSLFDAVSAAIDGDETPAATPEPKETPDESGDTGESATDGNNTDETLDTGGSAGEVADEPAKKASADGEDGDPATDEGGSGTGKPKAGAAPKPGAEGAAAEAAAKAAKEPLDPVKKREAAINDPIDQRLKESTRDRMQFLANEVKSLDSQLNNANTLFDAIDSTGMGPDELASMLGYARARHHGTPEQKQAAYAFLKQEIRAVALELGETDTVDFLADHADLQEAVAANTITAEYAKEVAISRSRAARDTQVATTRDANQTAQQEHAAGVQALNQLGAALATRDGAPAFLAKKDVLVATLKPIFARLPPAQWAQAFQQAYDAMPKPAAAAPVVPAAPAAKASPQPLRPGTPAGGGGKKEPKSMKEAVFAAFDTQD